MINIAPKEFKCITKVSSHLFALHLIQCSTRKLLTAPGHLFYIVTARPFA